MLKALTKNRLSVAAFLIIGLIIGLSEPVRLDGFESDACDDPRAVEKPVDHALLFRQR